MLKKMVLVVLLMNSISVFAAGQWYTGKINRFWPYAENASFIVTFEANSSLSDCKHNYAYFRSSDLGPEKMKVAMSIALSAFHSRSLVGVIIDKGAEDENCYASDIDVRR